MGEEGLIEVGGEKCVVSMPDHKLCASSLSIHKTSKQQQQQPREYRP